MAGSYNVLLVVPKFPGNSFWNYMATCRVDGARYSAIPLGLLTVAAMLPASWTCRLIDRNAADLADADLDWADMVMTGGMNVQRSDCFAVIARAQGRGRVVVVGGPDVTSEPHLYAPAEIRVIGEAEGILPEFIAAWEAGQRTGTFTAEKFKVDVTATPVPRFDLVKRSDYLFFSVQFSRGCPFMCEFCDIIELYGRAPRTKTPVQMLNELEHLFRSGYRGHVDFVDDNFIGNKKAVKAFLPHLIAWQREHDYPFFFSTEASVNLADDDDLLALMREAGFFVVFVGIESPDGDTLVAMQKKQNARRSLSQSIHKIYRAGMFVLGGFIVGFDTEKAGMADELIACMEEAAIPICMVGLLTALANTQLTRRLERENRLYPATYQAEMMGRGAGDQCTAGLNFETVRPRRDVLSDYKKVVESVYEPASYFGRVKRVADHLDCYQPPRKQPGRGRSFAGLSLADWARFARLLREVIRVHPRLLGYYIKTLRYCYRRNPASLTAVNIMVAFYLHLGPFSRVVSRLVSRQIEEIDSGRWQTPLDSVSPAPTLADLFAHYQEGARRSEAL